MIPMEVMVHVAVTSFKYNSETFVKGLEEILWKAFIWSCEILKVNETVVMTVGLHQANKSFGNRILWSVNNPWTA